MGLWRGWGLGDRGLLEHDEGHNLLAARTYREVAAWVLHGGPLRSDAGELATIRDRLHRQGGTLYPAGKPGYVVLLALSSFVVGLGQNPALWMSWMGGMICLLLVPRILREWGAGGPLPVAIAVTGIGMSPLVGGMSREVGGVIWALAFGMGGVWLFLCAGTSDLLVTAPHHGSPKGNSDSESQISNSQSEIADLRRASPLRRRRLIAFSAGLCLGYGFTCHYNLFPFLLAVFGADMARDLGRHRGAEQTPAQGHWRRLLSRWAWVIAGGLTVFMLFEAATLTAQWRLHGVDSEYQNYSAELTRIVRTYQVPALEGGAVGEGTRGWGAVAWRYAAGVAWREGAVALAAAMASLVAALVLLGRGRRELLPPVVFLGMFVVFWILHPWKVERSWAMVVVAWALLAGCVVKHIPILANYSPVGGKETHDTLTVSVKEGRGRRALLAPLLGVFLAAHVLQLAFGPWNTLWTARSPIPEAVRQTLAYVARESGSIEANSAAKSLAPLWKWAVIEEGRRPELRPALDDVDFSLFGQPDIVFLDPRTWNDPDFPATKDEIATGRSIVRLHSRNPDWIVSAVDLRRNGRRRAQESQKAQEAN